MKVEKRESQERKKKREMIKDALKSGTSFIFHTQKNVVVGSGVRKE